MEVTMSSTPETTAAVLSPQEGLIEELDAYCSSKSSGKEITEEGLREIIHRWGWSWLPTKKLAVKDLKFVGTLLFSGQLTEGMVETVLQFFPPAARLHAGNKSILHFILMSKVVTPNLVKILIEAYPPLSYHKDNDDVTALHCLCANLYLDASAKMEILELLLQKTKGMLEISTREDGKLPIHYAALSHSTPVAFMQKLIEEYPESVMKSITGASRVTPLHIACSRYNFTMVQTLVQAHPDCLNAFAGPNTGYPINSALAGAYRNRKRNIPDVSVVKFLVNFPGSKVASQEFRGCLPFHLACLEASDARGLDINGLKLVKVLFDAFPAAIMHSRLRRDMHQRGRFHPIVMEFLQDRLVFALPYIKVQELFSPLLPLHSLILNICCLGSMKLLVEGNPAAVQTPNEDGRVPLHLAVKLRRSSEVIQVLINHDSHRKTLSIADLKGNTALHYACLSANYEIIALLLEKYGAASVSKRNLDGKLPIQLLLFETNSVVDRNSTRYIESIFHLLRAFPDMGTY
eukprot:scaffold29063_cov400-Skeletonema_menzelii.AAC.1